MVVVTVPPRGPLYLSVVETVGSQMYGVTAKDQPGVAAGTGSVMAIWARAGTEASARTSAPTTAHGPRSRLLAISRLAARLDRMSLSPGRSPDIASSPKAGIPGMIMRQDVRIRTP